MNGGFFKTEGDIIPTIDEVRVPDFQWQTTFIADPSTDTLTTAAPHLQVAEEVVMLTSTGTLPAPLIPFHLYRVLTAGLGWARLGGPTDYFFGSAATDLITAPFPHGLPAGTPIFLYGPLDPLGDGQPSPLDGVSYYYVASSGLTATQFKVTYNPSGAGTTVDLFTDGSPNLWLFYMGSSGGSTTLQLADNDTWNPPPEPPPIDITDMGVGVHHLWIRPLAYVRSIAGNGGTNYLTGEALANPPGGGAVYLGNAMRHQYKNVNTMPGLPANTDLWTSSAQQRPAAKWQAGLSLGGTGTADLWAYAYPAKTVWGLGDLGVLVGGGEAYYSICGACAFGTPGGSPGGGAGGDVVPLKPDRQIVIQYRDQDITNLVRRAERASNTVENLRIVGQGVSGGGGNWQVNPD